jgi:hypothetical protein
MPRRKDLGVIDVNRGVIAYVWSRKLLDTRPGVDYYGICSANLKALSIQVHLISMMKFILGGENVNTQKNREVKSEQLHHRYRILNRQR